MLDNRPTMSVVSIAMLALLVMLPDAKAEISIDSFAAAFDGGCQYDSGGR